MNLARSRSVSRPGFTLLEILMALSILGSAMVVIMSNIHHAVIMYRVARETAIATTIAQSKMQGIVGAKGGVSSATEENGKAENDPRFRYQVSVKEANLPGFDARDLDGLFQVDVKVMWDGDTRVVHLTQMASKPSTGDAK